jgi:hypothetical protein
MQAAVKSVEGRQKPPANDSSRSERSPLPALAHEVSAHPGALGQEKRYRHRKSS